MTCDLPASRRTIFQAVPKSMRNERNIMYGVGEKKKEEEEENNLEIIADSGFSTAHYIEHGCTSLLMFSK